MQQRLLSGLSPEQRVLWCCARTALTAAQVEALHACVALGVDAQRLLREAEHHGLTPLVSRHLHDLGSPASTDTLALLRDATQRHVTRSLALVAELLALLSALRAEGIEALPVKGPVSAAMGYGDLGLRAFSDLDLLVVRDDVLRLVPLLAARGYTPNFDLSSTQQRRLLESDSELLFRHSDGFRLLDVHWSLMPRGYSFTPDGLGPFAARRQVRIGSSEVTTFGTEASLLFLILHGMKHDFMCLGWLCDIAELVHRHPALDWAAVLRWSEPPGRRRFIDVGLALVDRVLGPCVPEAILARGRREPAVERFVDELAQKIFAPRRPRTAVGQVFKPVYFRAMAQLGDRMRYVHDYLLRPTAHEWQAVALPDALAPAYYLVRPARLLAKYAGFRARRP